MASTPAPDPRAYLDVLYEALAGASTAVQDASALQLLERLVDTGRRLGGRANIDELAALSRVARTDTIDAGIDAAMRTFASPALFREAVLFARCLERDSQTVMALRRGRLYLSDAIIPPAFADLLTDCESVLQLSSFTLLWREPGRAADWLGAIEGWKSRYALTYVAQHSIYHAAVANIADRVDSVGANAVAVERLNTLARLGSAVAVAALAERDELERLYPCSRSGVDLIEALAVVPVCPDCAYTLGTEAPTRETRLVLQAIDRGLATQQARLARRVISRILAQPARGEDEKVDRFVRIVQASDVGGLALVLDDELVELIRDLLEPAPVTEGVLAILAREYPEVTPANLDAAVAEFRRLLEAGLVAQGRPLRLREGRP